MTTSTPTPDLEPTGTLTFAQALLHAETLARTSLPVELHERLSCAVSLVQKVMIMQADDGHTWYVTSSTDQNKTYSVNGSCGCEDSHYRAKSGYCKHLLASMLARKTMKLMQAAPPLPPSEPVAETPTGIDPRFLTYLHGKAHVKYLGLLAMAHTKGLVSLKARFVSVTADLALAEAEAVFADGQTFSECADATPGNVPAHIKPHFARMSLTRAKARALRDALNVGIAAIEELEGE